MKIFAYLFFMKILSKDLSLGINHKNFSIIIKQKKRFNLGVRLDYKKVRLIVLKEIKYNKNFELGLLLRINFFYFGVSIDQKYQMNLVLQIKIFASKEIEIFATGSWLIGKSKQPPLPIKDPTSPPNTPLPIGEPPNNPNTPLPIGEPPNNPNTPLPIGEPPNNPNTPLPIGLSLKEEPNKILELSNQQRKILFSLNSMVFTIVISSLTESNKESKIYEKFLRNTENADNSIQMLPHYIRALKELRELNELNPEKLDHSTKSVYEQIQVLIEQLSNNENIIDQIEILNCFCVVILSNSYKQKIISSLISNELKEALGRIPDIRVFDYIIFSYKELELNDENKEKIATICEQFLTDTKGKDIDYIFSKYAETLMELEKIRGQINFQDKEIITLIIISKNLIDKILKTNKERIKVEITNYLNAEDIYHLRRENPDLISFIIEDFKECSKKIDINFFNIRKIETTEEVEEDKIDEEKNWPLSDDIIIDFMLRNFSIERPNDTSSIFLYYAEKLSRIEENQTQLITHAKDLMQNIGDEKKLNDFTQYLKREIRIEIIKNNANASFEEMTSKKTYDKRYTERFKIELSNPFNQNPTEFYELLQVLLDIIEKSLNCN